MYSLQYLNSELCDLKQDVAFVGVPSQVRHLSIVTSYHAHFGALGKVRLRVLEYYAWGCVTKYGPKAR